jgi:hypothetical protein
MECRTERLPHRRTRPRARRASLPQLYALGVARADTTLWSGMWATDANSWALYVNSYAAPVICHDCCRLPPRWVADKGFAEAPVVVTCTADLQADRLTFTAREHEPMAASVSIPRLRECFVYAATGAIGSGGHITLIPSAELDAPPARAQPKSEIVPVATPL